MGQIDLIKVGPVYWIARGPVTKRLRCRVNGRVAWCSKTITLNDRQAWIEYIDAKGNVTIRDSFGKAYHYETD
jgi:hypothetical protein